LDGADAAGVIDDEDTRAAPDGGPDGAAPPEALACDPEILPFAPGGASRIRAAPDDVSDDGGTRGEPPEGTGGTGRVGVGAGPASPDGTGTDFVGTDGVGTAETPDRGEPGGAESVGSRGEPSDPTGEAGSRGVAGGGTEGEPGRKAPVGGMAEEDRRGELCGGMDDRGGPLRGGGAVLPAPAAVPHAGQTVAFVASSVAHTAHFRTVEPP